MSAYGARVDDELKSWLNARLIYENQTYDIQMRRRGDLSRLL